MHLIVLNHPSGSNGPVSSASRHAFTQPWLRHSPSTAQRLRSTAHKPSLVFALLQGALCHVTECPLSSLQNLLLLSRFSGASASLPLFIITAISPRHATKQVMLLTRLVDGEPVIDIPVAVGVVPSSGAGAPKLSLSCSQLARFHVFQVLSLSPASIMLKQGVFIPSWWALGCPGP